MISTNKNIRKLTKASRVSLSVILPREMIKDLGWREKQRVVATRVRGGILIKDWKK